MNTLSLSGIWRCCALILVLLAPILITGSARGSAALLLEMPYGQLGAFSPTGHAALYFDHICAGTPLSLRPCAPGEVGVVVSRYDGIGAYDWVAVPLIPYLYGVDRAENVPATMDSLTALRMRDLYRREHLEQVAPDTHEGGMPEGNWYELVGSAFDRTIYGFQMSTTAEQDAALIAYFNDRPNVTRYQGQLRNCADFARIVLNQLYPGSVRRNYVADFGFSTPKSVARGVVRYGHKHPELQLTMFRVPQLGGTMPRSMSIQGIAGSLLTRYGVPMAVFAPHVTAVVLLAYVGRGRFGVPRNAPVLDVADLQRAARNPALQEAETPPAGNPPGEPSTGAGEDLGRVDGRAMPSLRGAFETSAFAHSLICEGTCDAAPFLP